MEYFFTITFAVELVINFYGTAPFLFWFSGWNLFDVLVVSVGMVDLFYELPPSMKLLRMLRAFRVFRLFKRVKSLNKIIVSLGNAIPGVSNAFVVMLLVVCIYAILAVEFFGQLGPDGYVEMENGAIVTSVTLRGYTYGDEYYGTFFRSLYTMFQVLTGESWSEMVVRPVLFDKTVSSAGAGVFFISFILLCSIVLVNVVVAVLLEKMVEEEKPSEGAEASLTPAPTPALQRAASNGAAVGVAAAAADLNGLADALDGAATASESQGSTGCGGGGAGGCGPAEAGVQGLTAAKRNAELRGKLRSEISEAQELLAKLLEEVVKQRYVA